MRESNKIVNTSKYLISLIPDTFMITIFPCNFCFIDIKNPGLLFPSFKRLLPVCINSCERFTSMYFSLASVSDIL